MVSALKHSLKTLYTPLQSSIQAVQETVKKTTRKKVCLNHQAQSPPPLTKNCLETLSSSVTADWRTNVSWDYENLDQSSGVQQDASAEAEVGRSTAPKQLRVTPEVHHGLARLADRLGYVWTAQSAKQFTPNVNALLAGLGSGEAFRRTSVLGKSLRLGPLFARELSDLQEQVKELHNALSCFAKEPRLFKKTFQSFLQHRKNNNPLRNPSWPKPADVSQNLFLPSKQLEVPTNINDVEPADLQKAVADSIRKRNNFLSVGFATALCQAYGFDDPLEDGTSALAWQFAAEQLSDDVHFAAGQFTKSCVKCPPLKKHCVRAALGHGGRVAKKQIYHQLYPDAKQETFMMASTATTYRSRIGYKKLCPWGAWHGPAKAVQTKHEIVSCIKKTIPIRPSADGWFASIRAILELELESLLVQDLWSLEPAKDPQATCPRASGRRGTAA
eukprot:1264351-Rhodomonas_salina.1